MLNQRLLTALILIPIFILLLLKLSPMGFIYLITFFVMLAAWEWSALMGIKPILLRLCYPVFVFGILNVTWFVNSEMTLLFALMWWSMALALVLLYPTGGSVWGKGFVLRGLMGLCVLVPAWRALIYLRIDLLGVDRGPYILLYLFALIWGADSAAYFAGKKWGKNKLASQVSPGKTLQGLAGALVITVLLSAGLRWMYPKPYPDELIVIALGVVTILFSVLGDLFESMLKRNAGMKDSGSLFPGHGGLLDRIDSLTAAAPIFALGSILMLKIFH
jgi:phosphatidate cytidylyltransferase